MAHKISILENGRAEAAYAVNPAWHGLGTVLDHRMTAAEALENAHLNWEVEKYPLFVRNPRYIDGGTMEKGFKLAENFAVLRKDISGPNAVLGVVGEDYTCIQNVDQFSFFDSVVTAEAAIYEAAGALEGGKKVWLLAKLPENIVIGGKDEISNYLLLANSHNGSLAFTAKLTPTRVVCWNTLSTALAGKGKEIKIKHTANAKDRISEAARIMGIAQKQAAKTAEMYNHLAGIKFDTTILNYFLTMCFPVGGDGKKRGRADNVRQAVELLATKNAIGFDLAGHTMWGAVNAVSEYYSHHVQYKDKLNSMWFGNVEDKLEKSVKIALDIPNTSEADMIAAIKADEEIGKKEYALI